MNSRRLLVIALVSLGTGISGSVCSAEPATQVIGASEAVTLEEGGATVRLASEGPVTAGVLAEPILMRGADAAMALLEIQDAPERGVSLAMFDARSGKTVSYWQNTEPLKAPTSLAALLPLPGEASAVRLFAGTHDQPSTATIRLNEVVPLRRIAAYHTAMYGSVVSTSQWTAQTFTPQGGQLGGITIHARLANERTGDTPDLVVRLFKWRNSINETRTGEPLVRTVIANGLLPAGRPLGRDVDLFIPLRAATEDGEQYLIDFSCESGDPEQRYMLWCGPDGYDGGEYWIDGQPRSPSWDMHMVIYEEIIP